MLASEQAIVIAGTGEDWPDGRTLTPRKPTREPKASRQNNVAMIRDWCYPRIPWKVLSHR